MEVMILGNWRACRILLDGCLDFIDLFCFVCCNAVWDGWGWISSSRCSRWLFFSTLCLVKLL